MLPALFHRAREFLAASDQNIRNALARAVIPAAHVHAFADALQSSDAAALARRAVLCANAERLPLLAAALRAERATSTCAPVPRRKRTANAVSRADACESLSHAAHAFLRDPRKGHELGLALRACADAHGFPWNPPRLRKRAADAEPCAVVDAALDFAHAPNRDTLLTALTELLRYDLAIFAQHDAQPARLLRADVQPAPPPIPHITRAPCGALDWQTSPIIGANPCDVVDIAQRIGRENVRDALIAKRIKHVDGRPDRRANRANRVSRKTPKWHARLGKEVLTLNK